MNRAVQLLLFAAILYARSAAALTNGLALTPPMGWSSWNAFHCGINEVMIRQVADAMATNGMKDAGYQYVNIDDCWQMARTTNGVIVADTNTFPSGIAALAAYVHSKGLKFGIYSSRGTQTCGGLPGSEGYETIDAQTYAAWGVDYVKYDNCFSSQPAQPAYLLMRDAIAATGRPIVYSECLGYFDGWMPGYGNLWRTTFDIYDNFPSMVYNLDQNNAYATYAGPGHWNDPDMLEVGNGGMTETEYRAHFSLWCVVAAPLLAGNDLRNMTPATLTILTNDEAIAVDQDFAGVQGVRVSTTNGAGGNLEVWCKPLGTNGDTKAVVLFNRGTNAANITARWSDLSLLNSGATVRDLWNKTNVGVFTTNFTASVPPHGVRFLKIAGSVLAPPDPTPPPGTNYISDLPWLSSANGWGVIERDLSNGEQAANDGHTISINSHTYAKGLGTHANSSVSVFLGGVSARFKSDVGIDDETCSLGSVNFLVYADGVKLFESGIVTNNTAPLSVDVDVGGHRQLQLVADSAGGITCDHADWAGARLVVTSQRPPPWSVGHAGNQITFNGGGGSNGGVFHVIAATNLDLPANQWTPVATNHFDPNGIFLFTNTINPATPRLFYRLRQP